MMKISKGKKKQRNHARNQAKEVKKEGQSCKMRMVMFNSYLLKEIRIVL